MRGTSAILLLFFQVVCLFCSCEKEEIEGSFSIVDDHISYDTIWGKFRCINHRGYSKGPENTLPAYALSIENDFEIVETDVRFTVDDIPVLLHDEKIDRTSNGSGKINELFLNYVKTLDFGSWKDIKYEGTKIPTFEEFVSFCKNNGLKMYVELKTILTETQAKMMLSIIEQYDMSNSCTFISFHSSSINTIALINNKYRFGLLISSSLESLKTFVSIAKGVIPPSHLFVDAFYEIVDTDFINYCKSENLPLELWTVNDLELIKTLDPYITGITSDYLQIMNKI